jgi:hypothetical protein
MSAPNRQGNRLTTFTNSARSPTRPLICTPPHGASWEREFRELETEISLRNYSPKTLDTYRFWVTRFQAFVRSRPTTHLSNQEVRGFLSSLALQRRAAASSQNQAFNALLFFFRHVLHRDFGQIDGVVRAKRHRYIPVVLSRDEVEVILTSLEAPYHLVVLLFYGCEFLLFFLSCPSFSSVSKLHRSGSTRRRVQLRTTVLPYRPDPEKGCSTKLKVITFTC